MSIGTIYVLKKRAQLLNAKFVPFEFRSQSRNCGSGSSLAYCLKIFTKKDGIDVVSFIKIRTINRPINFHVNRAASVYTMANTNPFARALYLIHKILQQYIIILLYTHSLTLNTKLNIS